MSARELFEQLEKIGLADLPLVTNPYNSNQEDFWIETDAVIGWAETKSDTIFLETEY